MVGKIEIVTGLRMCTILWSDPVRYPDQGRAIDVLTFTRNASNGEHLLCDDGLIAIDPAGLVKLSLLPYHDTHGDPTDHLACQYSSPDRSFVH
jgi:hypothetical protein